MKSKEELSGSIYAYVEEFIKGLYEDTDGLKVEVIDDATVNVTVVRDADECEDEDVYPFVDFICYDSDADGKLHTDIDADYVDDVALSYFE